MGHTIFISNRLLVREFQPSDVHFIVRLVNTHGWLQFIGDKNVRTTDDALGYLSNGPFGSYRKFGFGMWHVSRTDNGESLGMCGLLQRQGLAHPDLGFAFLPEHQGKGYAFEAASATVAHGFGHFDLNTIFAITMRENVRAQALLKKVGMSFDRDILLNTSGKEEELMLFGISKPS
jgi:[ribosomal protein S5]-alanine N-acetyltransferase